MTENLSQNRPGRGSGTFLPRRLRKNEPDPDGSGIGSEQRTFARTTTLVLLAILTIAPVSGCGGYGEVSPAAYDCATALYAVCNRKAADKLAVVTEHIQRARAAGELSEQEVGWLEAIVRDAGQGDWESAARACRTMMEDQVGDRPSKS